MLITLLRNQPLFRRSGIRTVVVEKALGAGNEGGVSGGGDLKPVENLLKVWEVPRV